MQSICNHHKIAKSSRTWAWTFFECLWDKIAAGRSLLSARDAIRKNECAALFCAPLASHARLNKALALEKKRHRDDMEPKFICGRPQSETRALIVLFSLSLYVVW